MNALSLNILIDAAGLMGGGILPLVLQIRIVFTYPGIILFVLQQHENKSRDQVSTQMLHQAMLLLVSLMSAATTMLS